jgi:hypothetical protein
MSQYLPPPPTPIRRRAAWRHAAVNNLRLALYHAMPRVQFWGDPVRVTRWDGRRIAEATLRVPVAYDLGALQHAVAQFLPGQQFRYHPGPRTLVIRAAHTDPLRYPADYDHATNWLDAPFGVDDETGDLVCWQLSDHGLFAGRTGSGKSVICRAIVLHGIRSGRISTTICDPDAGYRRLVAGSDVRTARNLPEIAAAAEAAVGEVDRRANLADDDELCARELGCRPADLYHLAPDQLARMLVGVWGIELLVIEEAYSVLVGAGTKTPTGQAKQRVLDAVGEVARRGRKWGVILCVATQRADAKTVLGELRDNLGFRTALDMSAQGYRMVLEETVVPSSRQPGYATVTTPRGLRPVRTFYVDAADFRPARLALPAPAEVLTLPPPFAAPARREFTPRWRRPDKTRR